MSAELKPCPFCGGKGGIRRSHDADGMLWVGCQCQSCGASTSQEWCSPGNDCPNFYESIRGRWNRRPELETSAVRPDSCHCPSVPGEDCKLTAAECERRTQMNR
jgi:hypothetical protein